MRELDSWIAGIGMLIFAYLVLKNWNGANTLLGTTFKGGNQTITNLQGR